MTSWLGVALAAALGLVTLRCGLRRDVPGAVMAAGMAVMSLGMGGIGPTFVHGPWWAAGFAAVAVWPLVRPPRAGVRGGRTAHLLGGVAMIYMCALPAMGGAEPTPADHAVPVAPTGHHGMAGMGAVDLPAAPMTMPGPLGSALTLLGWALACYFLLATVTALTRRTTGGAAGVSRLTVLTEATMGLGTMVMLTACT